MVRCGLVISRVRYCIAVYGNGSAANDARLLRVINFAARVVAGLRKFDRISQARDDLGLLTPRQMCDLQTLTMAYKVHARGEPYELASMFQTFSDARNCDRVTRQDRFWRPPVTRTAAGQRSFGYRAATLMNRLPVEARTLNLQNFKRAARSLVV